MKSFCRSIIMTYQDYVLWLKILILIVTNLALLLGCYQFFIAGNVESLRQIKQQLAQVPSQLVQQRTKIRQLPLLRQQVTTLKDYNKRYQSRQYAVPMAWLNSLAQNMGMTDVNIRGQDQHITLQVTADFNHIKTFVSRVLSQLYVLSFSQLEMKRAENTHLWQLKLQLIVIRPAPTNNSEFNQKVASVMPLPNFIRHKERSLQNNVFAHDAVNTLRMIAYVGQQNSQKALLSNATGNIAEVRAGQKLGREMMTITAVNASRIILTSGNGRCHCLFLFPQSNNKTRACCPKKGS